MTALSDAALALDETLATLETQVATLAAAALAEVTAATDGTGGVANLGAIDKYAAHLNRAVSVAVHRGIADAKSEAAPAAVDLSAIYPAPPE